MFKRLCACASVVFLYGLPSAAQFADAGSGIQPYQKYDLTQIGAVNLYNGRLTVDVPLFDYKQVGQLPGLKIDLVMNSSSWVLVPYNGSGCNGCEVWAPVGQLDDNGTYSQTSLGKISYHAGGQYTYGFYAGPPYTNCSSPFYSYAHDYSGATHFFGNSESLDGTGLQLTINNGSVDIIDKNGISYKSGCAQENQNYNCIQYQRQIVDPNSNSISWNFNSGNQIPYSITDSVGRSIPLFDLTLASTGCHQVGFPGPQGASASTI